MLVLFAGLAAAQVGGTGQQPLTCATNVTVTPSLRNEGFTEQTGDITISCTGGAPLAFGAQVPAVNFALTYSNTVTSRLLPATLGGTVNNASEALLLIDEPGSGLVGFGPSLPQTLCQTPLTGCLAWVGLPTGSTTNGPVTALGGTTPSPNVYQGLVNGNQVVFQGVPAMPPTTTGSRVYRITNVRVSALTSVSGQAVSANISISGATSLPLQNPTPIVGFVSPGLTASVGTAGGTAQCTTQTRVAVNTLTFGENFGTAFKTRVQAQSNTNYAGQIVPPAFPAAGNQGVPGGIYNSESNFVFPMGAASAGVAGLADFGTRLKATFTNVPSGARIFVSVANVNNNITPITPPPVPGGSAANNVVAPPYVGYAQLINGESSTYSGAGGFSGALVTASDNSAVGSVPVAEVSVSGGTGAAVWEVVNTNPNTNEQLKFGVYISYVSQVASGLPGNGTAQVSLSYAPTATSGVASSSLPIPRFSVDPQPARSLFTISVCRTVLLYPYITNQAGFDTGLTVSNTSLDPYAGTPTGGQDGKCILTYYGGTTSAPTVPGGPTDTGIIKAGTVWVDTLLHANPGFQGYMFAVCNFQYAHGFAFISDVGARNIAMGYLALVMADPGTGSRAAMPFGGKIDSSGEQAAH
jgi:hypothetical protein